MSLSYSATALGDASGDAALFPDDRIAGFRALLGDKKRRVPALTFGVCGPPMCGRSGGCCLGSCASCSTTPGLFSQDPINHAVMEPSRADFEATEFALDRPRNQVRKAGENIANPPGPSPGRAGRGHGRDAPGPGGRLERIPGRRRCPVCRPEFSSAAGGGGRYRGSTADTLKRKGYVRGLPSTRKTRSTPKVRSSYWAAPESSGNSGRWSCWSDPAGSTR